MAIKIQAAQRLQAAATPYKGAKAEKKMESLLKEGYKKVPMKGNDERFSLTKKDEPTWYGDERFGGNTNRSTQELGLFDYNPW